MSSAGGVFQFRPQRCCALLVGFFGSDHKGVVLCWWGFFRFRPQTTQVLCSAGGAFHFRPTDHRGAELWWGGEGGCLVQTTGGALEFTIDHRDVELCWWGFSVQTTEVFALLVGLFSSDHRDIVLCWWGFSAQTTDHKGVVLCWWGIQFRPTDHRGVVLCWWGFSVQTTDHSCVVLCWLVSLVQTIDHRCAESAL